jgi:hypothetical protein
MSLLYILYISVGTNILFLALLSGAFYLLNRAGQVINNYEIFYQETLVDLEKHMNYVQQLMKNNVILSDDDDVQKILNSIKAFYRLMLGYLNAGNGSTRNNQDILR